jgi:hypothetical protein
MSLKRRILIREKFEKIYKVQILNIFLKSISISVNIIFVSHFFRIRTSFF